ncbi:MAG: ABC transporter ATP-binding protein [Arthrobacter sp.]
MTVQETSFPTPDALPEEIPVALRGTGIIVDYPVRGKKPVRAVHGVDIVLRRGETLGLVGESGCGKSTTGKALIQLPRPTSGEVWLSDTNLTRLSQKELRRLRRRLQLIFQDPIASLNPRRTAQEIVAEALSLAGHEAPKARAMEILESVGVDEHMAKRKPHELSGGQCQRISIARAIAQEPEVLICDEPVSALDVSVQAQVLNLLEKMKTEHSLSMIFISHDLAVVSNISDRVAVMYLGRICEVAPSTELYRKPRHHYTDLLLSSVPKPGVERTVRESAAKDAGSMKYDGAGCPFAKRCPAATEICRTTVPVLDTLGEGHHVACHHPLPAEAV